MRSLAFVCLFGLAVGVLACGGKKVNLPPVEPDKVEVFFPGNLPAENYELLARIDERAPLETSDQELVDRARAKAAELGADGLIVDMIRTTTEGQVEMNLGQTIEKIIEARVIYFPSRHPELMSEGN